MISTTIFPGRYIQGYDALNILGDEMKRFGDKVMIVCDPFVLEKILPSVKENIAKSMDIQVEKFGGECSDEEIERISNNARAGGCNVVAGIGGGKTLDTAKAVAFNLRTRVLVVPTIASTDAPCSALAVVYTPEGKFKRYLMLPTNPDVVLLDTKIIANAPVRFLVSGMGDALSTWFEAESCQRKYAGNMTGKSGSMTAYALARLCYDSLIKYGLIAKTACEAHSVVPAFEKVVEANTLLSGLGFESAGLAAAHAIHNGLTVLEQTHACFHGEKVAFGTLTSLFLTDRPPEVINEVYRFCEDVGLPTMLADIGLADVSDQELMRVAEAACAPGETIHNEPIPVTPVMVFSALKAADAQGKRRKQL